jgi:hypothetical protein
MWLPSVVVRKRGVKDDRKRGVKDDRKRGPIWMAYILLARISRASGACLYLI